MTDFNSDTNLECFTSWDDFDYFQNNESLLRGIYAYGFEKPSPIQQKAIKPIIDGKDIIAQAQSGTGKTGCFCIGTLALIDPTSSNVQAIILSPTRELAKQTFNVISKLSALMKNVNCQLLIGGNNHHDDMNNIAKYKPQIIVGCPGRINHLISNKSLITSHIKIIILDEADEIFSRGFEEQTYNIIANIPNNAQIGLFSATLSAETTLIASKIMKNPIKILVDSEMLTLEGIAQYYINVENESDKYDVLKSLFSSISMSQCIIYCNNINKVQQLYKLMLSDDYPVCYIYGTMDVNDRSQNYNDFIAGKFRVLISSDITARGIDIQQVSTVINYDVPKCVHTYLHRIGRSGRWGRKGTAINIVSIHDICHIKNIESYYGTQISNLYDMQM